MSDDRDEVEQPSADAADAVESEEYDEYDYEEFDEVAEGRVGRNRVILGSILALLILLLGVVAFSVVKLLNPPGDRRSANAVPGITWVRSIYGYGPTEAEQFFRPVDAAFSSDGTIWGVDAQRTRILGFNPDGTFKTLIHTGPRATGAGRLGMPEGICGDEQNNVLVTDPQSNKVMVFGPNQRVKAEFPVPFPLEVAARQGRIAVGSIPGISVLSSDGKPLSVFGSQGGGPDRFETAHGVAISEDGTIYVADTNNQRVKAYRQDGTLLWIWPANRAKAIRPGTNPAADTGPLNLPTAITIDGAGRLVVVDAFNFDLVVLQPTAKGATLVGRYGEYGLHDGQFGYPTGIDYDPVRDYFVVADTANDRLQIIRLAGSAEPGVVPAVRRFLNAWGWCCWPLLLLLLAIVLMVWRRRARERALEAWPEGDDSVPVRPDTPEDIESAATRADNAE